MKKNPGKNVKQNESDFFSSNSLEQNCKNSLVSDIVINADKEYTDNSTFNVRINVPILNVRKGPGKNYEIITQIKDRGIYTVMVEQNGWGKLRSGAGWICLDYTPAV